MQGEGKLVLKALAGAKRIEKIGGEGKAFWIAGENCTDYGYAKEEKPENTDRIWGRIEISTEGKKDDEFFNVMYVTDAANDKLAEVSSYESGEVRVASLLGITAVFVKSSERESKTLELLKKFSLPGPLLSKLFIFSRQRLANCHTLGKRHGLRQVHAHPKARNSLRAPGLTSSPSP